MDIDKLIEVVDDISYELGRIKDLIKPEEYESWFGDNLEQAYDLLSEAKDLICG